MSEKSRRSEMRKIILEKANNALTKKATFVRAPKIFKTRFDEFLYVYLKR